MTITKDCDSFIDQPKFIDRPKAKNLGIWIDHANAHLVEFTTDAITTDIISNGSAHRKRGHGLGKREEGMNNNERQQQSDYYKKLVDVIRNFSDVVLFGPTSAKIELLTILRADHQFEHIRLDTRDSDKMTQNKQHAFVRDYFLNR
jgi:hypothetical protein